MRKEKMMRNEKKLWESDRNQIGRGHQRHERVRQTMEVETNHGNYLDVECGQSLGILSDVDFFCKKVLGKTPP